MLPNFRPNGPTTRITVAGTATTPLQITPNTNVENNYVALLNVGTATVSVSLGTTSGTTPTPVVPLTTASTPGVVLPPNMIYPIVVPAPRNNFFVSLIGSAVNGDVYVTPLAAG
jgi:hypothetical protein